MTDNNIEKAYSFFDSHAHYYDERFYGEENPCGAEVLLDRLFFENTAGIINVGTNPNTNRLVIEQASKFRNMYAAVGLHPEDVGMLPEDTNAGVELLRQLAGDASERAERKIVAIGEIGLDYHFEPFDKEKQKRYFEAQLTLAQELDLPVIIHDREAHGDCFEMILGHPKVRGVFHSYSGSPEMACELIKRGWYISFSGVASFKNAAKVKESVRAVPSDRLLIETDAPYLAPHPFRGKINHSGLLIYTAEAIAEERGCTVEEIAELSRKNAQSLFGIEQK